MFGQHPRLTATVVIVFCFFGQSCFVCPVLLALCVRGFFGVALCILNLELPNDKVGLVCTKSPAPPRGCSSRRFHCCCTILSFPCFLRRGECPIDATKGRKHRRNPQLLLSSSCFPQFFPLPALVFCEPIHALAGCSLAKPISRGGAAALRIQSTAVRRYSPPLLLRLFLLPTAKPSHQLQKNKNKKQALPRRRAFGNRKLVVSCRFCYRQLRAL